MDKAQFQALRIGQVIYHNSVKNADGSRLRARVNGAMHETSKGWYIPFKHGLKNCFYVAEGPYGGNTKEEYRNPINWSEDDN